jgi:hypothetical protein
MCNLREKYHLLGGSFARWLVGSVARLRGGSVARWLSVGREGILNAMW